MRVVIRNHWKHRKSHFSRFFLCKQTQTALVYDSLLVLGTYKGNIDVARRYLTKPHFNFCQILIILSLTLHRHVFSFKVGRFWFVNIFLNKLVFLGAMLENDSLFKKLCKCGSWGGGDDTIQCLSHVHAA